MRWRRGEVGEKERDNRTRRNLRKNRRGGKDKDQERTQRGEEEKRMEE